MADVPELLAPLHPIRSVLAPADGARYTEVGGVAVLGNIEDRSLHELTAPGAVAWGLLDGRRTVAEVRTELGFVDLDVPYDAIIELLRRLRADGLVRDVDPSMPRPPMDTSEPPLPAVRIAAVLTEVPGPASSPPDHGLELRTERLDPEDTDVVFVELTAGDDGVRGDGQLLTRLADPLVAATAADRAVATLARLVAAAEADDLRAPGAFDLLAALAEQLSVT